MTTSEFVKQVTMSWQVRNVEEGGGDIIRHGKFLPSVYLQTQSRQTRLRERKPRPPKVHDRNQMAEQPETLTI